MGLQDTVFLQNNTYTKQNSKILGISAFFQITYLCGEKKLQMKSQLCLVHNPYLQNQLLFLSH